MAIFNVGGGGTLLNYDVVFTTNVNTQTLPKGNNIIQINTDLSQAKIVDLKKDLTVSTIKVGSKGGEATLDQGIVHTTNNFETTLDDTLEVKTVYTSQKPTKATSQNKLYYSLQKKDTIKANTSFKIKIPLDNQYITTVKDDWGVYISTVKPTADHVQAEKLAIRRDATTVENPTEYTFSFQGSDIADAGIDLKSQAVYIIVSSTSIYSSNSLQKGKEVKITKGSTPSNMTEQDGIGILEHGIFYDSTKNHKTRRIPVIPKHIYQYSNYNSSKSKSQTAFIYFDSSATPGEGIPGKPLKWITLQNNNALWEAPADAKYLVYSYTGTAPVINDYTIEYYLPKIYPYNKNKWIIEWFINTESNLNKINEDRILINNYDEYKAQIKKHPLFYLLNGKLVQSTNFLSKNENERIPMTNQEVQNNNQDIIYYESNGKEVRLTNTAPGSFNTSVQYYKYQHNPMIYFYPKKVINDWFNENCTNSWEFSSTESINLLDKNDTAYQLEDYTPKTYWIKTGEGNLNQDFNVIKTENNPINVAVTGIYCYYDISPIVKKIGNTVKSILEQETNFPKVSLKGAVHLYNSNTGNFSSIGIDNKEASQSNLAAYIQGQLNYIIDKNVIFVAENKFNNDTKIEGINFPNCTSIEGIATIDKSKATKKTTYPFQGCNLKSVLLPAWRPSFNTAIPASTVKTFNNNQYYGHSVFGTATYQNVSPFPQATIIHAACGIESLTDTVLTYNSKKALTGVKTNFPFWGASQTLRKIEMPLCSSIGQNVFNSYYTALTEVLLYSDYFSNEISIAINAKAFQSCPQLTSINLNHAVSIGAQAFENCTKLANIGQLTRTQTIGASAFKNTKIVDTGAMSASNITFGNHAFKDCTQLTTIDALGCTNFPNVFTYNDIHPFHGCTNLTELQLGVNSTVNSGFFQNFTKMSIVKLPRVPEIRTGAFKGLADLHYIKLNAISAIPGEAFSGCVSIESINQNEDDGIIAPYVSSVGGNAFANCTELQEIYFPYTSSDKTTGVNLTKSAFYKCNNIQAIYIDQCHPSLTSTLFTSDGPFADGESTLWRQFSDLRSVRFNNINYSTNFDINIGLIPKTNLESFEMDSLTVLPDKMFACNTNNNAPLKLQNVNCKEVTSIGEQCFIGSAYPIIINGDNLPTLEEVDDDGNTKSILNINTPKINTINEFAFKNTRIKAANLNIVDTIKEEAFSNSSINYILNAPPSGEDLETYQYDNYVVLSNDMQLTIGNNAFANDITLNSNTNQIKLLQLPICNTLIIGEEAFNNSININEDIASIDETIYLTGPGEDDQGQNTSSLTIGPSAFSNCKFSKLQISGWKDLRIEAQAFAYNDVLEEVTIDAESLELLSGAKNGSGIFANAFEGCTNIDTKVIDGETKIIIYTNEPEAAKTYNAAIGDGTATKPYGLGNYFYFEVKS